MTESCQAGQGERGYGLACTASRNPTDHWVSFGYPPIWHPAGIREVPTADGAYRFQSPAGEHLIMDCAAKLVQGCAVAVFLGGKRRKARPRDRRRWVRIVAKDSDPRE